MKSAPPSTRLASLLLGLLYLLAWGEPVAWHPCPMHDGITGPAAAAVQTAAHAVGGHAHHAAASDHGLQAAAPVQETEHDDHACQCLGHGCGTTGVLVPMAQAVRWRVLVARRAEPPAPAAAITQAAAPRLLPFANGPPGLA